MMNDKKSALLLASVILLLSPSGSSSFPVGHYIVGDVPGEKGIHGNVMTTIHFASTTTNTESTTPENSSPQEGRQRRPRYSGKYPRNFDQKYKEHQGDEETVVKVLSKGMTPAGTHVPIMLAECLQYMGLQQQLTQNDGNNNTPHPPLQQEQQQRQLAHHRHVVVDCTLGYGGHAEHILQALVQIGGRGRQGQGGTAAANNNILFGFDQDSIEIAKTTERLRQRHNGGSGGGGGDDPAAAANIVEFVPVNQNFATLKSYLEQASQQPQGSLLGQVTCLLADLGLSSMQIDDNKRGFTYKREGPLDMRMNPNDDSRETAHQLLQRLKPKELQRMLEENSDEVFAKEIAHGLLGGGKKKNDVTIPETTLELANRVRDIVQPLLTKQKLLKKSTLKPALDSTVARTMQAIRIEVNGEFQALEQFLQDLPDILAPGGTAVFLTFHSGEDRRVKKALKDGFKSGIYSSWSRDVVRPSSQERRNNPRSSCCKLRWAVKQQV